MIHTSTSEVYGTARTVPITEDHPLEPQSPYAASKVAADKLIDSYHRSFDLPVDRPAPVQHLRAASSRRGRSCRRSSARRWPARRCGSARCTRAAISPTWRTRRAGFIAVAEAGDEVVGRTLQLGTGTDVSIGDLVQVVGELLGKELAVELDPARVRPAEERGRAADLEPRARGAS